MILCRAESLVYNWSVMVAYQHAHYVVVSWFLRIMLLFSIQKIISFSPSLARFLSIMTRGKDTEFVAELAHQDRSELLKRYALLKSAENKGEAELLRQMEFFADFIPSDFVAANVPGMLSEVRFETAKEKAKRKEGDFVIMPDGFTDHHLKAEDIRFFRDVQRKRNARMSLWGTSGD